MNLTLGLAIILLLGLLFSYLAKAVKTPVVTGFIVLGILIGPYFLNLVPHTLIKGSGFVANITLGFIAFSIGQDFYLKKLKKLGIAVLWISIGEVFVSWLVVSSVIYFVLKQPIYIALLFGAIAPATAPAATVMVIREYKARGTMTDIILGVVAIDDAWGLILFAVSLAIARSLYAGSNVVPVMVILRGILDVLFSFIIGGVLGYLLNYFSRFIHDRDNFMILTVGFVLFAIGISTVLNVSVLLSCMFLGAVIVNISSHREKFFDSISSIDSPIYLIFFVLVGANLEILSLKSIGVLGITYFFARPFGEWLGAYLGAIVAKTPKYIRKYVGLSLVPQAGVALGMALLCKSIFPEAGEIIMNVIIATTVLYELTGPFFTKYALAKAKEI